MPKKPEPATRATSQSPPLDAQGKRVPAIFYRTEAHGEPVREWLKGLSADDRKRIGEDIKTVEFGWPIGMPVCKPLGDGIYEVRTALTQNRIARVLFYIDKKAAWFFCTRSSRKRKGQRTKIWHSRRATKANTKGDCNECHEEPKENGPQRINLR